ncbi:MAG: tRNA (guanine-N1)-methyltransferase [Cyanobacteria bacterium P01_G01_bin.19]
MTENLWYEEGQAKFRVGRAFYNPASKLVRDLGVLAATIYRQDSGSLRVLDALGGCGVRSLRYFHEAKADYIWLNEGNPDNRLTIEQNLKSAINSDRLRLTYQDAHRVFFSCYDRRDYYDLVDVDCFGSAVPYLNTMLYAAKIGGLMYLTSTDGRTLTGHPPQKSVAVYGAIARSHPARHEQALRLLIGATQQQASARGLGIQPIFSLFTGKTYRLMLRLLPKPSINESNYGFLGYCHHCGNYQTITWRQLNRVSCSCPNPKVTVSGAMWLGDLHDFQLIQRYIDLAQKLGWQKTVNLLKTMAGEIGLPPCFYTLQEIGKHAQSDLPKRSHLIEMLQEKSYQAAPTHINPQAIKTNASIHSIIDCLKNN